MDIRSHFRSAREWVNKPYRGPLVLEGLAWGTIILDNMMSAQGMNTEVLDFVGLAIHCAAWVKGIHDSVRPNAPGLLQTLHVLSFKDETGTTEQWSTLHQQDE